MYYVWFFLRRLLYVANLIFLRDFVALQFSLNILLCIISLGFLWFFVPYKGRLTNIVAVYSECAIISLFAICASFEFGYSSDTSDTIMWAAIGIVFSIMLVNYVDILIWQYIAISEIYRRCKNRNKSKVNTLSTLDAKSGVNMTTDGQS